MMAFDMSFRFRLRVVTANDISRCIYALTMTQPCDVKHANTVHVDGVGCVCDDRSPLRRARDVCADNKTVAKLPPEMADV